MCSRIWFAGINIKNMRNLLIVGVGRSGTSLLQSMLAAHAGIVMMPETSFIRRYLVRNIWPTNPVDGLENLSRDDYLKRWERDGTMPVLDSISGSEGRLIKVYRAAVENYGERNSAGTVAYVGDKDPKMIEVLPHLNDIISDYKVVHIIRDPRDVLLSKNKAAWSQGQSMLKKLVANAAQLRIVNAFKRTNRNLIEVKYEELLIEPEKVLADICQFLEIDYDPQMLNFQGKARELVSSDEMSWKKETMGPLLKTNFSKWREELTVEQCDLIEKCCGLAMAKGGNKHNTGGLDWRASLKNRAYAVIVSCLAMLYAFKASKLSRAR